MVIPFGIEEASYWASALRELLARRLPIIRFYVGAWGTTKFLAKTWRPVSALKSAVAKCDLTTTRGFRTILSAKFS